MAVKHSIRQGQIVAVNIFLTCSENVSTTVAPGGELRVVACPAVDPVGLGAELLVHQRRAALVAHEA